MLSLRDGDDPASLVEHNETRTCGSLIYRPDVSRHPFVLSAYTPAADWVVAPFVEVSADKPANWR